LQEYIDGIETVLKDATLTETSGIEDTTEDLCATAGPDEEDVNLCICTHYPHKCVNHGSDIRFLPGQNKRGVTTRDVLWKESDGPSETEILFNISSRFTDSDKTKIRDAISKFNTKFDGCIKWKEIVVSDDGNDDNDPEYHIYFVKEGGNYLA